MAAISPVRIVEECQDKTVMEITNETGIAQLTKREIYPGIDIVYLDAHIQQFSCYAQPFPHVFAINHCEEGRVECEFQNGEFLYMGPNDMSVGWRSNEEFRHTTYFPRAHYHGLSIVFHVQKAQPVVDRILGDKTFDIAALCNQFCQESDFGMIMEENKDMKHLFQELYHVPDAIQYPYCQLKVVEILLMLSTIDSSKQKKKMCFTQKQVEIIKAIRARLVQNLQEKLTIEELSEQYAMSQTLVKRIFKGVYGTTIRQYLQEYRVQEAQRMLLHTNESIVDVAMHVGYANCSKFAAAFKKHTGILPKEYRRIHQITHTYDLHASDGQL